MKNTLLTLLGICAGMFVTHSIEAKEITKTSNTISANALSFIENKGQIIDQHSKHRNDIDYKLVANGMTMFIGDAQLHYQWSKMENSPKENPKSNIQSTYPNLQFPPATAGYNSQTEFYRMDVELIGADKNAQVIAEGQQDYVENYYLPQCPNGVTAHAYTKVTYKNVYPYIDWVVYVSNLKTKIPDSKEANSQSPTPNSRILKYDFIIHPGGDASQIKLQYNGATTLALKNGALIATTPFGSITENAPYSYYADSKEEVASSFQLNENVLSYNTPQFHPATAGPNSQSLIIDPGLNWCTYYGGTGDEAGSGVTADTAASAYMCGGTTTTSNMATTGTYQSTFAGTYTNAIAVKFNKAGARQWATYYGGSVSFEGFSYAAADTFGNVYFSGYSGSSGMATTGTYQDTFTSTLPYRYGTGLLVKFNAADGTRIWATYHDAFLENGISGSGGTNNSGGPIACDKLGNVYLSLRGVIQTGLATSGAFQTTLNGTDWASLLTRFNGANGTRTWATYYYMDATSLTVDPGNNVYWAGLAFNVSGITTAGAFKTTFTVPTVTFTQGNGFLAKFSSAGARLWATYYGEDVTYANAVSCDDAGNVFMGGFTYSATGIATTGTHSTVLLRPASGCGFLAKFNSAGARLWGTYNGSWYAWTFTGVGFHSDGGFTALACDRKGNVYGCGQGGNSGTLATPDAIRSVFNGNLASTDPEDKFLAVFNPNGTRRYSTLLGGPDWEFMNAMAISRDKLYIGGNTQSSTGLSTSNAYQPSYGGNTAPLFLHGGDLYLAQFQLDTNVFFKEPLSDTVLCGLDTMRIPYGVTRNFRSANTFTIQLSSPTGSFASPTTIATITGGQKDSLYKWRVPVNITAGNGYRIRILANAPFDTVIADGIFKLHPLPVISSGSNAPICSGNLLNLTSSPFTGADYSWKGPGGFTAITQNTSISNAQTTHSGRYILTATLDGCSYADSFNITVNQNPTVPAATSNSPICEGADLLFTASNTVPGVTYSWVGPGFTSPLQNPVIASAKAVASGTYTVSARLGPCIVNNTVAVVVNIGPTIFVYPSPNDSMCAGKKLTMVSLPTPSTGGTGFQWQKDGVDIPGATSASYAPPSVIDGDIYSVKMVPATSYGCNAPINSNGVAITVLQYQTPFVTMTATDTNSWPGLLINFEATAGNAGDFPKYQWKLNGKNVTGATGSTWGATTLQNNDSVCVEVSSSYLCASPATVTTCKSVKVATGIHDINNSKLHIYPNPAGKQLTVDGLVPGAKIQLNDVYGRVVYSAVAALSVTTINTANLIPGNYILQVTDVNGARSSFKLVKE